jgi:hypothetical protein
MDTAGAFQRSEKSTANDLDLIDLLALALLEHEGLAD